MKRIALISDIHGNLPALEAVIGELDKENPDIWLCLGDVVGYGPHPAQCIDLIRQLNMKCVMGNHDAGVAGVISDNHFRYPNRKLIKMTRLMISKEQLEWIKKLPMELVDEECKWFAVHASPDQPHKWEYLNSAIRIRQILSEIEYNFCFVGHTHRPGVVSETIGLKKIQSGHKYVINPGSVGQSRDGDPRASCGILDLKNYTYKNLRVSYKLNSVVNDLEKLGFSSKDAERLIKPRII